MTGRSKPRYKPLIRAVDLFCGAGGLTHGLERSGVDVAAGVDLDPACEHPYERNNNAEFILADVNTMDVDDLATRLAGGHFSLLAGCAPCQPFSSYSQSGRSSKRPLDWQLAERFADLVQELQPDLITMENVPQLADHSVFEAVRQKLKGYALWWSVVQLSTIGVPQSRKRLVVLGTRLTDKAPELDTSTSETRTVRDVIHHLDPIDAGSADTNDRLHTSSRLSKLNMRRIRSSRPGGTWRDWDPALLAECHRKETGQTYPSVYGRMEWDKVSPTITTQSFGFGNGRFGHPEQHRAISLREAAILQTFPDDYSFLPEDETVKFATLGRLIGNAVPVALGEAIGQAMLEHASAVE